MNLCENGLRYSERHINESKIKLCAGVNVNTNEPYLDIIDFGLGVAPGSVERIFEPFYTSEHMGTGLGLYVAKELCESNQARLELIQEYDSGACFRITFNKAIAYE